MANKYPSVQRDIDFLRLLQEARSQGVAHRKGDSFKKVSEKLGLTRNPTAEVFTALLRRATEMIDGLTAVYSPPRPHPRLRYP